MSKRQSYEASCDGPSVCRRCLSCDYRDEVLQVAGGCVTYYRRVCGNCGTVIGYWEFGYWTFTQSIDHLSL